MIYLFYGNEPYLIEQEIDAVIKANHVDEIAVSKYDLDNDIFRDVLEDAITVSLFSPKKIIVCQNSNMFNSISKKQSLEQDISLLNDYMKNMNNDTIMIFVTTDIDERKKIVKEIKEIGIVKECNTLYNVNNVVKDLCSGYKIDYSTINFLVGRVGKNLNLLKSEIEKLKLYKIDEKEITMNDVLNLTNQNIDANSFELIDCIIKKNKEKAINIYKELLKNNEEPIMILVMLANKFRTIYQVKELARKGYSEKEIIDILEMKPYPIKLALQNSKNYDSKTLLNFLLELSELDDAIKSNRINKESALEMFILKS